MEPGQGLDTAPGRDTGTVVKWDDGRGFGFIKPETGGDDVFCHSSEISDGDALQVGAEVTYEARFDDRKQNTLFVGNLPWSIDDEGMLYEFFEGATSIRLPREHDGRPKGFAYVEFMDEPSATSNLLKLEGLELGGRAIRLDYGQQSRSRGGAPSSTLFVGNLPWSINDEGMLNEYFEGATSVRLPREHDGRPKGFAYVEYPDEPSATAALNRVQGIEIGGRTIRLDYDKPRAPLAQAPIPQAGGF
eukprot:gene20111-22486_t